MAAGAEVFKEGDVGDSFYIVLHGSVEVNSCNQELTCSISTCARSRSAHAIGARFCTSYTSIACSAGLRSAPCARCAARSALNSPRNEGRHVSPLRLFSRPPALGCNLSTPQVLVNGEIVAILQTTSHFGETALVSSAATGTQCITIERARTSANLSAGQR